MMTRPFRPYRFLLLLLLSVSVAAPAIAQLPPRPPRTPPPNTVRSGGSLGGGDSCVQNDKPLVALVPVQNPVLTTNAHPTFLFYVPYSSAEIQFGEFSVLRYPGETTRVYRTRFTLPQRPGIVSISLPNLPENALQPDNTYHWYLKLYCQGSSRADLEVDGFVQRVASTVERDRQIQAGTPEIWYDALANTASQVQARPQDAVWRDRWRRLLTSINAESLTQVPLVGSVQPVANRPRTSPPAAR